MAFLPTWHWLTVGLGFFLEASLPHHLFFPSVGLGYRRGDRGKVEGGQLGGTKVGISVSCYTMASVQQGQGRE